MLPQEKPAKKKFKLLARLPARSTAILDDVIDLDDEPNGSIDLAGLDDSTDSDESGPGEQESTEEDELLEEEGSDQETAVADDSEEVPVPSPVVARLRKRKRTKATGEHL